MRIVCTEGAIIDRMDGHDLSPHALQFMSLIYFISIRHMIFFYIFFNIKLDNYFYLRLLTRDLWRKVYTSK